jgi:ribosomal protein S12 methylthiotransferase accessory factor YcaO
MCGNFTTKTYNISTEGNTSSSSTPTLQELWETEGSLAKAARIVQIAWRTILNKIGIPQVEAQLHKSLFFSIKSGKDIFLV